MKCDAKAFSKLYEQVYQDLYRYALCLMRDPHEAEDAVSAAVLSAYEHIHKLRKEEAFKSWIFTILSNVCKKRLKQVAKEGIQQKIFSRKDRWKEFMKKMWDLRWM